MAGGTQPLLLAKEEDVSTKRSKPTEDNKFCHEQVHVVFLFFFLLLLYKHFFLIVALDHFSAPKPFHAVEMYVDTVIGKVINSWSDF